MGEKYRDERVEYVEPERGCASKFGGHCRRFWWFHLIVFSLILMTIMLPFVYVAYPNMAQQDVNRSTLEITSMKIREPTPDSFHVEITQVLGSKSPFHPYLDAFNASVHMAGSSVPFATLLTPRAKAVDGAKGTISQTVMLPNVEAFTNFSTAILLNEKVNLTLWGKTGLKLGGLPKTIVTYNKTVTMKGLNELKGFNLTKFHLVQPAEADGTNMRGTVLIPNPSVLSLQLGTVTLDLSVDGTSVGKSRLENVIIEPGDNLVEMASTVNQTYVLGLITAPGSKYPKGIIPLDVLGKTSVYNGKELSYFSKALASKKLRVDLNVLAAGK